MNLEQITGLTFVEIPAGTYTVGLDQNQAKLVTASERTWMIPNYIPVQSIQLPSFFISTDVVRLSHWQKLQNSPFAGALQAAITKDDLLSHQYNFIRDVRYGHKLGWYQVVKDREEINPALTLPFSKSVKFAQILGTTLPNWAQWEVSARGSQAYLFPWGDTFDLNKVKLSYLHYSYTWEDPESIMGLCRETDHISGTKCRIDSFGDYLNAVSPFGLKGLIRWGMEWNTTDKALPNPQKSFPNITTHLIRSICDLEFSQTTFNLSKSEAENEQLRASNHRAFSGTPLPFFIAPESEHQVGAFRLIK